MANTNIDRGYRFLGVELSDGIKGRHMLAYMIAVLVSSSYAGALSVLQPGLLHVMGIPQAEQAMVTGNLSAMQEVVLILLMGVMGALSDTLGRKTIYVFGLLTTALGFVLYPLAENIYQLALYRLIVALGGAAMITMMITVVADYSLNRTRGKANGLQGAVATLGAFVPPLLGSLPSQFVSRGFSETAAQQMTFGVSGSLGVVAAVVVIIGMKTPLARATQGVRESLSTKLKQGLTAAKDSRIALSYGAAFISRGDLAVTGAFMSLWLVQYGTRELGLTVSEAMFQLAVPRVLAVVCGALIGSIVMGQIADRIRRTTAVCLSAGMATAAYTGVYLIGDPTADWVIGLLLFMGIAEISAFVSSQALVGQQAAADRRGSVIGFFGVAGAVGILIATSGGGWLYAHYGPSTPFVMFGLLNGAVFVWGLIVRSRTAASTAKTQSYSSAPSV